MATSYDLKMTSDGQIMRNNMRHTTLLLAIAGILSACQAASVHTIETTAVEHSSTLAAIMEDQVKHNLRRFHGDKDVIPEHVAITAGGAQVNASAGGSVGASIIPGADTYSLGAESSIGLTANWSLIPVTDRRQLERLSFLYIWVVTATQNANEEEDLTPVQACEHCLGFASSQDTGDTGDTGQDPLAEDLDPLEEYLLYVFGSKDNLGRRNHFKWSVVKDADGNVTLDKNGKPTYTAEWISPKDEAGALKKATESIPTLWYTYDKESDKLVITDPAGFRDFVLLTLSPGLQTIGGTDRLAPDSWNPAPSFAPFIHPLLLDPNN